jgi:uncharacterized membrane protein
MHSSPLHYVPLALPFFLLLAGLFLLLLVLIQIRVLRYVYEQLGISSNAALGLLLASLLGSYINIPVAQLPQQHLVTSEVVSFYGVQYAVPAVVDWPGTIIAVNVGGALVPALLSAYLLVSYRLWAPAVASTAVVAAVCYALSEPVPGLGIAVPIFAPPLTAVVAALLVARQKTAAVAYVGGSLGTLIGADLLNLGAIQGLGAPVASIGGAGTFDGIFLTGVLAVLLASLWGRD